MTTGTMTSEGVTHRVRILWYAGENEAIAEIISGPLARPGNRYRFLADTWRFDADTPEPADTPTNREKFKAMAPGTVFEIVLVTGDPIGKRMKVNERWYVDVIGNLEPRANDIIHLVDSKYTIVP